MTRSLMIFILFCSRLLPGQEIQVKLPKLLVDDRSAGHTLFTYTVPADGYYSFAVDGGLLPGSCTIYYCEYRLELKSDERSYSQELPNIGSQAQDGNVCRFGAHEKNNRIGGVFRKGETVQLRLVVSKSDVNGKPHRPLAIAENSRVSVSQMSPVYAAE